MARIPDKRRQELKGGLLRSITQRRTNDGGCAKYLIDARDFTAGKTKGSMSAARETSTMKGHFSKAKQEIDQTEQDMEDYRTSKHPSNRNNSFTNISSAEIASLHTERK